MWSTKYAAKQLMSPLRAQNKRSVGRWWAIKTVVCVVFTPKASRMSGQVWEAGVTAAKMESIPLVLYSLKGARLSIEQWA